MCCQTPEQIAAAYAKVAKGTVPPVPSFDKPTGGSLRVFATRHCFMAPGHGVFQFDGKLTPKSLSSIANANWDAMKWGPHYNDHTDFYSCWNSLGLLSFQPIWRV